MRAPVARQSGYWSRHLSQAELPVALNYCFDHKCIDSLLLFDFIPNASSYNDLKDTDLLNYLEYQDASSKTTRKVENLERIVKKDLRTDMRDDYAVSCMRNLFVSYHELLCRQGFGWVTEGNQKIAVQHVTSAVKPEALRTRLQSDLSFS